MMPFLKANTATAILAAVVIVLLWLLSDTIIAGVALVIAVVGWYFLADKFKNQSTSFNTKISTMFKNSNNQSQSMNADNETAKKLRLAFIVGSAVTLVFLFIGPFLNINSMIMSALNKALSGAGIDNLPSSFSFNGAINQINSILSLATSTLSDTDTSDIESIKTVMSVLSFYKWIMIIAPIITLIFSFIKNTVSTIIRIISSFISTLGLLVLPIAMSAAKNDDRDVAAALNQISFGVGFYLALLGAIVALVASIMWIVRVRNTSNNNYQYQNQANTNFQYQNSSDMNMQNYQPQNGSYTDLPSQNNETQAPNNQVNPENQSEQPTNDSE